MNRFLKNIALFLIPVLSLLLGMEIAIRNIPNDYSYKNSFLKEQRDSVSTLILGSSHTYYGLDPVYFTDPAFNLAHVSQTFDLDFDLLKKASSVNSHLKTVVIPVSYFSFFEVLGKSPEYWRIKNYTLYYNVFKIRSLYDYSEMTTNSFEDNYDRIEAYYQEVKKGERYCSDLGWGEKFKSENSRDLVKASESAVKRHFIEDHQYLSENIETLNRFVDYCKRRDIKVLLFTPPGYKAYFTNLDENQLNITIKEAQRIAQENSNCEYFSLLKDDRFVEEDFFDGDHLNEIGAKKLSLILNEMID